MYIVYISFYSLFDKIESYNEFYMKMKREDHSYKKKTMKKWIEKIFSSHVFGKIGMELITKSYGSFFSSYAVRMACWK